MSATRCPSLGSIIVGGKTVGVVQCTEDAGHDIGHDDVCMCGSSLGSHGWDENHSAVPGPAATPHRAVLEWENDTVTPDLDLLDPAEELVDPLGIAGSGCEVAECVRPKGHAGLHDDLVP